MGRPKEIEIYTEVTNKEIDEALAGDTIELWNVVSSLEGNEAFNQALEKIKYGIKINFDIRSITEEEYEKKTPFGEIWIERKLQLDITKYRDEIDARKKMMKDILRSLYDDTFDKQEETEIHGYK